MRKPTTIGQKLLPSLINIGLVLTLSMPLFIAWGTSWRWRLAVIAIFFIYSLAVAIVNENRCVGMIIMRTDWQHEFTFRDKLLYAVLYSASFSTVMIWVFFPFDLLLINLLLIQLPFILITGTTAHGYLSGKNVTVTSRA